MSKPETSFIRGVHKYIPADLHHEKMNNPYRGGTADCWYSGKKADLWIEYKYLPKIPARSDILPDLSALQKDWLLGRYAEGRNVAVVVGCPEGGVVYRGREWENPLSPIEFRARLLNRKDLGAWIVRETCGDV